MPRVPRYPGRQVQQAPIPGVRRTAAPTADTLGAGVADQLTNVALQLHQKFLQEADETRLIAEDRGLADWEHSTLDDPEQGAFARVKGKDALELHGSILGEFDRRVSEVSARLPGRVRRPFEALVARRRANLALKVGRYTESEVTRYHAEELAAAITTAGRDAIANATDDHRVEEEVMRQRSLLGFAAERQGLGPEASAKATIDTLTTTHRGVIRHRLSVGQAVRAVEYYQRHEGEIAGEARAAILEEFQTASAGALGLRTADDIWAQHGPANDHEAINLDVMERAARERAGDDEAVRQATVAALRERYSIVNTARASRQQSNLGAVWGRVTDAQHPASLREVYQMPEYLALDGKEQANVVQGVLAMQETAAQRAAAAVRRGDDATERAQWGSYWTYSQPAALIERSEADILRLLPELGQEHVNRLMQQRRALVEEFQKTGSLRAATIDEDLFKQEVRALTGLNPYGALDDQQREQLGRLKVLVESTIDARQRREKNRELDRTEKRTIMRDILADHVKQSQTWGQWFTGITPGDLPAALVINPDQRARAYVPLETIRERDPQVVQQSANFLRSYIPGLITSQLSDDEIVNRFQSRIERAYALRVMGATRAEIEAALRGGTR